MSEILYQINPDRRVPWNDLPALPIKEELYETVEIMKKLGDAKASLARLHGRSAVIPNQGLLINTISLQEAKLSSEIENIFTTDDELYKAYSDQHSEAVGASKEVIRYREALWSGYNYLKEGEMFNQEYFIKIFQEIKQTTDKIRPPFIETTIKLGGTGPNAGQVIYTPPRGGGILEEKIENLVSFINDDEQYNIDHLLKMAIAHFQFEAIHPFRDGNGRTGRVFNIHYLTSKGLLDYPILFFDDSEGQKWLMVLNRNPFAPVTLTLTFMAGIDAVGEVSKTTAGGIVSEVELVNQQMILPLTAGDGRLFRIGTNTVDSGSL